MHASQSCKTPSTDEQQLLHHREALQWLPLADFFANDLCLPVFLVVTLGSSNACSLSASGLVYVEHKHFSQTLYI